MLFGHQNDTNQPVPAGPADTAAVTPTDGVNPLAVDPVTGASLPVAPAASAEEDAPSVLNQPMPAPPSPDGFMPSAPPIAAATPFPAMPAPAMDPPADPMSVPDPADDTASFTLKPAGFTASQPQPDESNSVSNPFTTDLQPDQQPPEVPDTDTPALQSTGIEAAPSMAEPPLATPTVNDPAPDEPTAFPATDDLLNLKQQALSQLGPLVDQLEQSPEERFRTTMMMIQSTDNQSLIPRAYEAAQAITNEKIRAQALLDIINEINYFTQQKTSGQ
jgi:hypothetical protein